MLKIDNLYYWHNVEHSLLNGIDLTLQKGELLTILGGAFETKERSDFAG